MQHPSRLAPVRLTGLLKSAYAIARPGTRALFSYHSEGDQPERGPAQRGKPSKRLTASERPMLASARAEAAAPTRQALQGNDRSKPGKITGRLKVAFDAMVWQGLKRADAAALAGLKEHSLYVALTRPHVRQEYLRQCEVLRLSGKARRITRLEQLSEQDDNKQAAINAIRALDQLGDEEAAGRGSTPQVAGFVIVLRDGAGGQAPTIDVTPAEPQRASRTVEHEIDE